LQKIICDFIRTINNLKQFFVIGAKVGAASVLLAAAVGGHGGNGLGEDRKVEAFRMERFQVL
jgi:hypothetical protein